MWIKADHAADTDSQCHKDPGGYMHWACLPNFPGFTTEWVKYEQEFTIPAEGDGMKSIAFNLNKDEVANTYYFADIHWQVTQKASAASKYFYDEETITNGNMTGTDMSSFVDNKTWAPMVVSEGEGPDGGNCIKFTSSTSDVNSWDSQVFIVANRLFAAGDTYNFEMDVKASEAISIGTQTQKGAGGYIHWAMLPANVEFTTEWTHVKFENAKIPSQATDGMNCIALCLGTGKEITYEIANVSWIRSEQLDKGTRALNQEEKSVAVTNAFTSWVTGAINGLGSSVTEWNFLDNLISDNGNVRNLSFNYNDYLKEDYIVMAEKLARETYAEVDTISPQALKLYLNQKNLQDAGVLAATKTLISDLAEKGVKIDGISTDITVNALSDLAAQKSSIVAMLKELNAMKLPVRISSVTVNGKTDTFSGLQDISEAYKMAVSSYVTNIDAANQRAIYVGGDIDKTLWFDSFTSRQPAYAGFADGLKGK